MAERKCTTGVMPEGADLGVGVATGTVVGGPWEDYGPACSGAEDSVAFCRLPLEAVAVAVHLQDVDVVGEAVQQCPG